MHPPRQPRLPRRVRAGVHRGGKVAGVTLRHPVLSCLLAWPALGWCGERRPGNAQPGPQPVDRPHPPRQSPYGEYSADPSPESVTPIPSPTRADRTEASTNLLTLFRSPLIDENRIDEFVTPLTLHHVTLPVVQSSSGHRGGTASHPTAPAQIAVCTSPAPTLCPRGRTSIALKSCEAPKMKAGSRRCILSLLRGLLVVPATGLTPVSRR